MRTNTTIVTGVAVLLVLTTVVLHVYNEDTHKQPRAGLQAAGQSNDFEKLSARLDSLENALLTHAKSNKVIFLETEKSIAAIAAARQSSVGGAAVASVGKQVAAQDTSETYTESHCGAILPAGLPARTKEEVMAKSKLDKQYGKGIQESKDGAAPKHLVDSAKYWEDRYAMGGNSGAGSYNQIGVFKAQIMNGFVKDNDVKVVIEFGFGDGQQLTRAEYPRYIGVDVSKTILKKTSERFASDPTKEFRLYDGHPVPGLKGDVTLSFDVIYHLVEDAVFHEYMASLFAASTKFVVIYSSNIEGWHGAAHVLHRDVTGYVASAFPDWKLLGTLRNKYPERTAQDYFFYGKC
eukprot:m.191800 g.191800  ORF g.191800 m.191800 type:complete len:349 (-) comp18601_c0_seq1:669-1715(-)